jgi:hypothetical protein
MPIMPRRVAVELAVQRLAPARRHAVGHVTVDARADRIAGLAQRVHVASSSGTCAASGQKNGLSSMTLQSKPRGIDLAELRQPAATRTPCRSASHFLAITAPRRPHRGLARARAPAAARIADAVLLPVGVVGVAGAELLGDVA